MAELGVPFLSRKSSNPILDPCMRYSLTGSIYIIPVPEISLNGDKSYRALKLTPLLEIWGQGVHVCYSTHRNFSLSEVEFASILYMRYSI